MRTVGQRMFLDLTPVVSNAFGRRLVITVFGVMEARASAVLRTLADDPRFPIRSRSPLAIAGPVIKVAVLRAKVPLRLLTALVRPSAAPRVIARVERRLRASMSLAGERDPGGTAGPGRESARHRGVPADAHGLRLPATGLLLANLARRLLGDLAQPGELQTVLRGLPHNVTTEMDLELWQLTQRIRADHDSAQAFADGSTAELTARYRNRTLPSAAQRGITAFLRRYGHRAVAEIDLGMPRWADDPSHIIGVIANYLRLEDPELAPEVQFKRGRGRRRVDDRRSRPARGPAAAAEGPRGQLRAAPGAATGRPAGEPEVPADRGARPAAGPPRQVGEALVERRAIDAPDDIYFLDYAEARRGLQGESMRTVVAERREAYAAELRRRHIPRLLLSDGTELEAVAGATVRPDGALTGSPASPGTVTGRARVVLDPVGAHLEPGEILVAPSTDPGWTPLFLTAGGLVMEMGGSNSHGAVVAREYGIPAVVGVPDATAQDRDRSAGHRRRRGRAGHGRSCGSGHRGPLSTALRPLTAPNCRSPHQICRGTRRFNTVRARPGRSGGGELTRIQRGEDPLGDLVDRAEAVDLDQQRRGRGRRRAAARSASA